MKRTIEERFWAKVEKTEDGCWLWTGAQKGYGYGQWRDEEQRHCRAHRWAYEHFVGPIPGGLELDHLCRVRLCVNPAHLEPVTRIENIRRSPFFGNRVKCLNGHPLTGPDADVWATREGYLQCRVCRRARRRKEVAVTTTS